MKNKEIKDQIRKLNNEIEDIFEKSEAKIEKLKVKIRNVQNECKHSVINHVPDPSGNNDSFDECLICGKVI